MLPAAELRDLGEMAILALDMASTGYPGEGYTCLLEGFCRAKKLRDSGAPWGGELIDEYRRILDDYAHRFDVARE